VAPHLSRNLVDRLVCAKYIFRRSCELLDSHNPYSAGLAVSGFQDSIELVLRTIAEHLHVSLADNVPFSQIMDKIDAATEAKLPYRATLNQLNKARANFKHSGLEPKEQDAIKIRRDLEVFFPRAFNQFFTIDFDLISLIDLIGHRRTENFLHEAERAIEQEDYQKALRSSVIAFYLYRRRLKKKQFNLNPFNRERTQELKLVLDDIKKLFEDQQEQLDILMDGINPIEFQRFERLTPQVKLSMAHTITTHYRLGQRVTPSREDAFFCSRFALDSILLMKSIYIPPSSRREPPKANFKVIKKAPAIVWPEAKEVETIRDVEEGELFSGSLHRNGRHVMIILDEESAYIPLEAVEEISGRNLSQRER
jgi:hypothetical protein